MRWVICICLWLLTGCSGGLLLTGTSGIKDDEKKNEEVSDENRGLEGDVGDDFEITAAIPMALTGQDYFAYVVDRMPAIVAGSDFADLKTELKELDHASSSTDYFAHHVHLAQAGEVRRLLTICHTLLQQILGENGVLKGLAKVPDAEDGFYTIRVLNGSGNHIWVLIDVSSPDQVGIDLYQAENAAATPGRLFHYLAKRHPNNSEAIEADFSGNFGRGSFDLGISGRFDTALNVLELSYGLATTALDGPGRASFRIEISELNGEVFSGSAAEWGSRSGDIPGTPDSRGRVVTVSQADIKTRISLQRTGLLLPEGTGALNWSFESKVMLVDSKLAVTPLVNGADPDVASQKSLLDGNANINTALANLGKFTYTAGEEFPVNVRLDAELSEPNYNPEADIQRGILGELPDPAPPGDFINVNKDKVWNVP